MMHTPGPWRVQFGLRGSGDGTCLLVMNVRAGGGGLCIAETYPSLSADEPTARANANLIAAAPDLLEALKTMVDKCEPLVGDLSSETSPHIFISCMADVLLCIKQAVEDAEVAIAEAEGK